MTNRYRQGLHQHRPTKPTPVFEYSRLPYFQLQQPSKPDLSALPIASLKSVDAINMLPMARCIKPFEGLTLSISNADSTLQIVKEQQPSFDDKPKCPAPSCLLADRLDPLVCTEQPTKTSITWWRMTGSNRRPPACKAGALPAELIPHGDLHRPAIRGGSGWIRTNDPRLIKTVL